MALQSMNRMPRSRLNTRNAEANHHRQQQSLRRVGGGDRDVEAAIRHRA